MVHGGRKVFQGFCLCSALPRVCLDSPSSRQALPLLDSSSYGVESVSSNFPLLVPVLLPGVTQHVLLSFLLSICKHKDHVVPNVLLWRHIACFSAIPTANFSPDLWPSWPQNGILSDLLGFFLTYEAPRNPPRSLGHLREAGRWQGRT